MNPAPRVQSHNRPINGSIFEPASAVRRPRRALHESGNMCVKVSHDLGFRGYGFYALGLHLFHDVDHVLCSVLEDGEYGSMADWSVGAKEHWFVSDEVVDE